MSPMWAIIIAVGGTLILAAAMVVMQVKSKKRRSVEYSQQVAEIRARGWNFEERDDSLVSELPPSWLNAPLASTNHAKQVENISTGRYKGWDFLAARFELAHSGEDTSYLDSLAIRLPVVLPRLRVGRTTKFESRVNTAIGRGDRELESGRFNDKFDISTDSDRFATDVLNPRMMEWLLDDPLAHGKAFWIYRDRIYYSRYDFNVLKADHVSEALDFLVGALEHIPPFVFGGAK